MKNKKRFKDKDRIHVWITDDLTAYRSRLAFLARLAVKEGHWTQTWCHEGKIFMKTKTDARPQRIVNPEDIPGMEEIELEA